jgi:hypothetical protein
MSEILIQTLGTIGLFISLIGSGLNTKKKYYNTSFVVWFFVNVYLCIISVIQNNFWSVMYFYFNSLICLIKIYTIWRFYANKKKED